MYANLLVKCGIVLIAPLGAQLIITGSGTKTPSSAYTIKLPGGYSASDPSINMNIYTTEAAATTTYKVPGPGLCFYSYPLLAQAYAYLQLSGTVSKLLECTILVFLLLTNNMMLTFLLSYVPMHRTHRYTRDHFSYC